VATPQQVAEREQWICIRSGHPTQGTGERHHRMRRREGSDGYENSAHLCQDCHHWITHHPEQARADGWIVTATGTADRSDPALVPVPHWQLGWVLLDADGGYTLVPDPGSRWHQFRAGDRPAGYG
jgi:hypothetical protein